MTPEFERFAAIDWSGAKGKKHKGIAIALCDAGNAAPRLVRPTHVWSRTEVLDWLVATAAEAPTLFGFDFSFAPPIAVRGEYLPGEPGVPTEAKAFWAYVDRVADDEDLGAASFLERAHRRTRRLSARRSRRPGGCESLLGLCRQALRRPGSRRRQLP